MCVGVCVDRQKHGCAVLLLENRHEIALYRFAIHILRKMPTKSDESSVECYGHGF